MRSRNGPTEAFKFADAHRPEFRESHAEIAQSPGHILVFGIELGQKPGLVSGRVEELDDGRKVFFGLGAFDFGLFAAIGEQLARGSLW